MEDLIEHGRVRRAALRVNVGPVATADARAFELPETRGAVIQDFPDDSPAEADRILRARRAGDRTGHPVRRGGFLQRAAGRSQRAAARAASG